MSKRRFNVERSREIRQWIGLAIKTVTGMVTLDFLVNNGEATTGIVNKLKLKVQSFKDKIRSMKNS